MNKDADFLVVGGGIVGLMMAHELCRRGVSVIVADAGYPQASVASVGILSALPPWRYNAAVATLIDESNKRLSGIIYDIEASGEYHCELSRPGMLALQLGTSFRPPPGVVITPARWLAPGLTLPPNTHGVWMPDVRYVRVSPLLAGLSALLKKEGVRFVHSAVSLDYTAGQIGAARLQNGDSLRADNYIICAGARSGDLCPLPLPPIMPRRGQILLFRSPKPLLCIVLMCADGLYFMPRNDGLLAVGASFEDAGFDDRPSAAVQAALHQKAASIFTPLGAAEVINSWSGLRPCLPDDLPIIDVHPCCDNLYLNIGHGRYGMSMASAAARHLLKIMAHPDKNNPFTFSREWDKAV